MGIREGSRKLIRAGQSRKYLNDHRVKLCSRPLYQDLKCLSFGKASSVGPIRAHRVIAICNGKNAGMQTDILPCQTCWVRTRCVMLPFVAGCCRHSDCRATEADASCFDHHHHEYLRGRGDERDGPGSLEGCGTRPVETVRGFQTGFIARMLLKIWRREWDSNPLTDVKQRT